MRKFIRKYFIMHYDCDIMKMTGMIALENELHFKGTGRIKEIVLNYDGCQHNKINNKFIEDAKVDREKLGSWENVKMSEITKDWINNNIYIKYFLEHKIPDKTGRYGTIVKNIGIALGRSDMTNKEIIPIVNQIVINMPGRERKDFWGWIHSARQGKMKYFNENEMMKWFEENRHLIGNDFFKEYFKDVLNSPS